MAATGTMAAAVRTVPEAGDAPAARIAPAVPTVPIVQVGLVVRVVPTDPVALIGPIVPETARVVPIDRAIMAVRRRAHPSRVRAGSGRADKAATARVRLPAGNATGAGIVTCVLLPRRVQHLHRDPRVKAGQRLGEGTTKGG